MKRRQPNSLPLRPNESVACIPLTSVASLARERAHRFRVLARGKAERPLPGSGFCGILESRVRGSQGDTPHSPLIFLSRVSGPAGLRRLKIWIEIRFEYPQEQVIESERKEQKKIELSFCQQKLKKEQKEFFRIQGFKKAKFIA